MNARSQTAGAPHICELLNVRYPLMFHFVRETRADSLTLMLDTVPGRAARAMEHSWLSKSSVARSNAPTLPKAPRVSARFRFCPAHYALTDSAHATKRSPVYAARHHASTRPHVAKGRVVKQRKRVRSALMPPAPTDFGPHFDFPADIPE